MNFLFTCGGTAGHINPALAVAGRLRELMPECGILFVGAQGKMETNLVPLEGYDIKTVNITNISRGRSLGALMHNIDTVKNVMTATRDAKKIIEAFKPDAAIGTGGYVCYPVLKAAADMGVPTAVHESNAVPGLTTKMLSDKVDRVMVGFEDSREYYKHPDKVTVTGTPVRGNFSKYTKAAAKRELGIPADRPLVLSVWGSLGAAYMNGVMTGFIELAGRDPGFNLIHAAGNAGYEVMLGELEERAPDYKSGAMELREYIYDMPRVMAAADLIMCRAGASTLAELTYMGKPVILVPSPNVTNNHQEKNARLLEAHGGAEVLLEREANGAALYRAAADILRSPDKQARMKQGMLSLGIPDATERIYETVMALVK